MCFVMIKHRSLRIKNATRKTLAVIDECFHGQMTI